MPTLATNPTLVLKVAPAEIKRHNRWNPGYFDPRFQKVERQLRRLGARPLGDFIPEVLPDGSKGITYGQVGARHRQPARIQTECVAAGVGPRTVARVLRTIALYREKIEANDLVRGVPARARRKVLLAEVREHWADAEGQQQGTDVFGELEEVVSRFLENDRR